MTALLIPLCNALFVSYLRHAHGSVWSGVDIRSEDVADNFEAFVWEPSIVKVNAITAASEVGVVR